MDAYSSLLNLNFMASLRTGNVVADMLIAMLIPFVSGLVVRFFSEWWPQFIGWMIRLFKSQDVVTMVAVNRERRGNSADLDENDFLQSILMHYVATRLKPIYQYGSYQYKRLLTGDGSVSSQKKQTLVDVLKTFYVTQTVPTKGREVELNPSLFLRISENSDEADNIEGGGEGSGGNDNSRNNNENDGDKKKLKPKTTTLIFRTCQGFFTREDAMSTMAKNAFEYFQQEKKKSAGKERFLYQPLMSEGAESKEKNEPPRCQRYKLSHEKTFATLFFPEKEKLIELIHQFENKTGKFAVPGFPRKLILLLYGPPGTGKTSLVKAIAEHTRRNIFSIPLSRVQTNRQLLDYMFDTSFRIKNAPKQRYRSDDYVEKLQPDQVIYMLEDVDAASEVVRRKDGLGQAPTTTETTATHTAPPATSTPQAKPDKEAGDDEQKRSETESNEAGSIEATDTAEGDDDDDEHDEVDSLAETQPPATAAATEAAAETTKAAKEVLIQDDDSSDSGSGNDTEEDTDKDATGDQGGDGEDALGSSAAHSSAADSAAQEGKPKDKKKKGKKEKKGKSDPAVDRVTITEEANVFMSEKDKLSIKGLLEVFGGILDTPGRIVILTTNHLEHLDPVLLRPGVVTMKLHMGNFDAKCGVDMVRHYFASQYRSPNEQEEDGSAPTTRTAKEKPLWNEALLTEVAKAIEEAKKGTGGFSPAEVEQLCAENETIEDLLTALRQGSRREIF